MMSYQVHPIRDRYGRIVGFLDAQYVLNCDRRVIAEVRAGAVLRFDGRLCGEYDGGHFFDRTRAVVATITAPEEFPLHTRSWRRASIAVVRVRPLEMALPWTRRVAAVRWSSIDWRRYIEV